MKFSLELRKQWILDRKIGYLERKRKRDSNRNVWHRFSIQFHLLFILLIAKTQHMAEPQPENSCMCVCVCKCVRQSNKNKSVDSMYTRLNNNSYNDRM